MIHVALSYVILALIGVCAFRYVKAHRAWTRQLASPAVEQLSVEQREAYVRGSEYLALRTAVRKAIYGTTLLSVALYVVMHLSF
jgi:hypothetical protein